MVIKKLNLPVSSEALTIVEKSCVELMAELKIKGDITDTILIAVTELVNNAMIHGNKMDQDKKLIVVFEKENGKLIIKVYDEGQGYDDTALADPTSGDNIYKTSGRGVYIVKALAHSYKHYMSDEFHVAEIAFTI